MGANVSFSAAFAETDRHQNSLPDEKYWDALLAFEFAIVELLPVSRFMEKIDFQSREGKEDENEH